MTVDPDSTNVSCAVAWTAFTDPTESTDIPDWVATAYIDSYRGPHNDALGTDGGPPDADPVSRSTAAAVVTPGVLGAHWRLAQHRPAGGTRVAAYADDDPAGFGPALQVVTEHGGMLMDSVAVLLHRLGVAYLGIMTPVFTVRRNGSGELRSVEPQTRQTQVRPAGGGDRIDETWIHVQLSPSVDRKALAEAERLLPNVMADVRQVATDSTAMAAALSALAGDVETDRDGHFAAPDRQDVAALLHWLANGHFVLLGYQRGLVHDGHVLADESARLGVLRLRKASRRRLAGDKLLMLTQATVPSYMRFGSYTYTVAIRENSGDSVVEHRFVGLFTVAAMNTNVLEIPIISRTVQQALALSERQPSHPGQLLLDIVQTVPRSELFAMSAERLLTMAMAVADLGSRRRALLFLRADQLGRFVSCLVYLPRDRYTTAVRLHMQDILVTEFGGSNLEYTARVSEAPWALVHFMVRVSDGAGARTVDTSEANRVRIQARLTESTRTWADRLVGAVADGAIAEG
ncbi:MAG: NAD-glutamate dehydrogenase, partial [Mycobacterium sp.]